MELGTLQDRHPDPDPDPESDPGPEDPNLDSDSDLDPDPDSDPYLDLAPKVTFNCTEIFDRHVASLYSAAGSPPVPKNSNPFYRADIFREQIKKWHGEKDTSEVNPREPNKQIIEEPDSDEDLDLDVYSNDE